MSRSLSALPGAPPVEIRATGWGWRHASRNRWALRGLDFVIEPGERVLLLGASGSGKSTLLQAISGVLGGSDEGDSEGTLLLNGMDPAQSRGQAGLLLQDPDSQVILARVGDDVAFGCENMGVPREQIWPRVRQAVKDVGLDVSLERSTAQLSGGQKQRLALAGLIAMRPGALLLDEPTANLDPQGVIDVRNAVASVLESTGATFVVVEHRVAVWLPLITRVIVLAADGGILADGAPDAVLRLRAKELENFGVWVPERPPALPERSWTQGTTLLTANDLGVGRKPAFAMPSGASSESAQVEFFRGGLSFDLSAGTATAITGPNGSGKTTLGLTLAGLLPPVSGAVVASDTMRSGIDAHPIRWKSRELLTRIGTVFQEPEHQFLKGTLRDELAIGPHALGLTKSEISNRVDELLLRLGLAHLAEANPFTLSGGEKRRLSVATVLATKPRLMVLDEPTFGQDSRTWRELIWLFAELLSEGRSIVAMTHDQLFVDALASHEVRL